MQDLKEKNELINQYINGSVLEMAERIKALKTKFPASTLPDAFHNLASNCEKEIDIVIASLEELIHDPRYQVESNLRRKIVKFQSIVRYIEYLENKIVAPLQRVHDADIKATKLVRKICREVNYPLLPPVVSCLSQEYYTIDTKFNHLRAPLLEADFLLHLPDIYHELCHSILVTDNDPRTDKLLEQIGKFIEIAEKYCSQESMKYKKNGGNEEAELLELCSKSWINWSIELFCDLFATYTVGPAFAWANLHLCLKKGGDAFETPLFKETSHPANNSRMIAALSALELMGLRKESNEIKLYWETFLPLSKSQIDARYKIAFPNQLIEQAAVHCFEGVKAININPYQKNEQSTIRMLLNEAWQKFIHSPIDYLAWERLKREKSELL